VRPHPPLSEQERKRIDDIRFLAVWLVLAGSVFAVILATRGDVREAAACLLAPLLYLAAALAAPLRQVWLQAGLRAAIPVVVGVLLGYPLIGAALGIGLAVVLMLAVVRSVRGSGWDTVRALEPTDVDPQTAAHVAAFEALGFEQVGAYGFDPEPERTVVVSVLIGPGGDRYAAVTDVVFDVFSVFGRRVLVTRNSAKTSLPAEFLTNDFRGAEPAELVELVDAHERALEVLRARGLRADPIERERLVEMQLALERRCIEWGVRSSRRRVLHDALGSGLGGGPLDASASALARVEAWLVSPAPAL
jgi:hypothetical protein